MGLRRWLGRNPRSVPRPESLVHALDELTACPCDAHRTAFLTLFDQADELLFLVADADRPVSGPEQRALEPDERIALQTVGVDGRRLLLAFPDEATALRHDRAAPYAGFGAVAAAVRVLEDPTIDGILVTTADEGGAWASVSREHLRSLIDGG